MEKWTIAEKIAGRCKLHLNQSGKAFWCMFDYVVEPAPEHNGILIEPAANANAETVKWMPDLKAGMDEGWLRLQEHSRRLLTGFRVEVTEIHTHPVMTDARACRYYGSYFICWLGEDRAVRAP